MRELRWLPEARTDLERVSTFLRGIFTEVAEQAIAAIETAAGRLRDFPASGRPVFEGTAREAVIPFGASAYILCCREDPDGNIVVIRLWHARERRD